MNFPFSTYDFIGYLACGFLVVVAVDYSFDCQQLVYAPLPPSTVMMAVWLGVAYIVGHLVANISSYFLEHRLTRDLIGSPEVRLFNPASARLQYFFPIYSQTLPDATRKRILDKSTAAGFPHADRALFFHCHAKVKGISPTNERLSNFINVYGFCRNVSMACAIAILIFMFGVITDWWQSQPFLWNKVFWAALCAVGAVGMFYRYLKFFRHYTIEVFTTYAET